MTKMAHTDERYGLLIAKDIMVPMRDGVRLATDLYRPARDGEPLPGPFPTILCRTPYNKSDRRYIEIAEFFTPRGYVTVLQDLRGRYQSEGMGQYFHTANPHDGLDGYDTVEWIAAKPWSNGKVGMVGSSFAAVVQVAAALERPPHLTAIWPDVTPTNNFFHQAREGGAMQMHMFWALFVHAQDELEIWDDPAAQQVVWEGLRQMRTWIKATPWQPGQTPLAVVPRLEQILFDYYTRGEYDDFWAQKCNNFEAFYHEHADIAGLFSGGWFDPYATAMTDYYAALARRTQTPQRLIMGPWTHVGMRGDSSFAGDVDFGPTSVWGVPRYFAEQLRYFAQHLQTDSVASTPEAPVRIFVMGGGDGHRTAQGKFFHGGQWRDEQEWPLARTQQANYYLHADGTLRPEPPTVAEASRSYSFDPAHPVPTIGGSLCGIMELPPDTGDLDDMWLRFLSPVLRLRHIVGLGAAHQKEEPTIFGAEPPYPLLADRSDVLVFQTEPLTTAMEVTGSITVHLWIASSALDTDFTAKLIDVAPPNADYPNGYHLNLIDSVLRVRYRNGWTQAELMEPGQIYPIQITLAPTSNHFQAGHRLRIDISSSNFPRLDINPNTGEAVGKHTHTVIAHNTVYCDQEHPSYLRLPLIAT
ncbi:MAG: CocE/NonD family hydrolase [Caldilineaceae bacterium]|nr:CocE/NonD family hydrolase [Caldilineaceae bacterium]